MSPAPPTASWLVESLLDARKRTLEIVADLDDRQLMGPRLAITNPLLWEIGHLAWFQERWALRTLRGEAPLLDQGDRLYDSSAVPHDTRWDLPLLSRQETLRFMARVLEKIQERIGGGRRELTPEETYFHLLILFHEDMHDEAFVYTRQTLGFAQPELTSAPGSGIAGDPGAAMAPGDVEVPGGPFFVGATPDLPFVFDNEKWAHPVHVEPFAIARAPVTQREYRAFTDDGGYRRRAYWSDGGWAWREREGAEHPVYWRADGGGRWSRRRFDAWVPLEDDLPVVHVNRFEADAYCRWAGRRLPTEAEWELAATGPAPGKRGNGTKRLYPWGDEVPGPGRANLDAARGGCVAVGAHGGGDSPYGCRQMIGNVWEWTATTFLPYPGFVVDPYKEYSRPWFGTQKVLRGGCWVTRSRLIRNTWRNFYTPDRRDVWAGFRTCAVRPRAGARRFGL